MPSWMPKPLLLALGLVLLGHWTGLSWLRAQLPAIGPLALMREPLFTRVIEPVEPTEAIALLRAAPPAPKREVGPYSRAFNSLEDFVKAVPTKNGYFLREISVLVRMGNVA